MKVPLSWLKEIIATQLTGEEIAKTLTLIGLEVEKYEDSILEIALTPNLSHCASIRGIARELSAVTQEPISTPSIKLSEDSTKEIHDSLSVHIENSSACPRYACRLIEGVRVAPSPAWLKARIEQAGMQSVNNVVDCTNYVMLEWGHPLHAFDAHTLKGSSLIVRNAKKGEMLAALDGKDYFPTEETLLICDAEHPIAIAGIIGGAESEISEHTTDVILEAAYFDPIHVRKASKRMGIHTEASFRFERGTNPEIVVDVLNIATAMIIHLAGGKVVRHSIDKKEKEFTQLTVSCRLGRVNQILGTKLALGEVETLLQRLDFTLIHTKENTITVRVPPYRHDIHHEIDLIEEVARLFGYDNLYKKERPLFRTGSLPHCKEFLFSKTVRSHLIAEGLQEFLTCDLISPAQAALIANQFPSRTLVKILNPRSIEQSIMRPSLLPGMLSVLKYNADHGIHSVSGFEIGRVHFAFKEQYYEPSVLSVVQTGEKGPPHWEERGTLVDFFDLKGILANLLENLKVTHTTYVRSNYTLFHPGRQAALMIGTIEAGIVGEVHPLILREVGLEQPVYFAEINLEDLELVVPGALKMKPLPQYPASVRDWTVTVKEEIEVGRVVHKAKEIPSDLLESVSLIDIYRSERVGAQLKNLTLRFVYRDLKKTISLSAVENEHLQITKKISEYLQRE